MRPPAQPTLLDGEYCPECPLGEICDERNTSEACSTRGGEAYAVHPSNPDVFWDYLELAPQAGRADRRIPLPRLPAYVALVKKEITAAHVRALPSSAVGFTITQFFGIAARAERSGVSVRELLGTNGRRIVVVGADEDKTTARAGSTGVLRASGFSPTRPTWSCRRTCRCTTTTSRRRRPRTSSRTPRCTRT